VKWAQRNVDPLPLSLLNDFLYCPRRAALKAIEGWWGENEHTVIGTLAHDHADLPGYEVLRDVTLLRSLPVWSERLGLSGECDIVERHADGSVIPVEYKKGRRRTFENDDAQLCAQALCLEEMFGSAVRRGAVFHAQTKRRREVEFDSALRDLTERAIADLHALVDSLTGPPAVCKPTCDECSLFEVCLPKATCSESRTSRLIRQLFEI